MKKSTKMTGYNDLKVWMERQYGASRAEVTITCNGQTYIGHMYGSDECFDGNEFYQYFLTADALLRMYYNIPDGCTDFNDIDCNSPYDVRADDAQYWIDYVI
jgi:hypothetical protein